MKEKQAKKSSEAKTEPTSKRRRPNFSENDKVLLRRLMSSADVNSLIDKRRTTAILQEKDSQWQKVCDVCMYYVCKLAFNGIICSV